ncbi:Uncharacterised protein [uncultured archaeon]|nr:Uncharacterised protein [uncultured archaeon]
MTEAVKTVVDLSGQDCRRRDFSGQVFPQLTAAKTDFREADFTGTRIGRLDAPEADLRDAKLAGMRAFDYVNLKGAKIKDTQVEELAESIHGVKLSPENSLETVLRQGVKIEETAKLKQEKTPCGEEKSVNPWIAAFEEDRARGRELEMDHGR